MRFRFVIVLALFLYPPLALAADLAERPSTRPAVVESKPVVKDGVSIVVALKQQAISTNSQPQFTVRFTNVAADYINLYDVDAYCDWKIEFKSVEQKEDSTRLLTLKMDKIPFRIPLAHRQIKPGESTEVNVDLTDPPFTFHYESAPLAKGGHAASARHIPPGNWRVAMTIKLQNPFGAGYHEWEGPLTTQSVELVVGPPNPDENADPTPEQAADYSAAIRRSTEPLFDGMWLNGGFPEIKLPSDAKPEDVIEAAVNQTSLGSKSYRILKVEPFSKGGMPEKVVGSAALVRVGKAYKVVVFFPFENHGWWSRFYDAELSPPAAPR